MLRAQGASPFLISSTMARASAAEARLADARRGHALRLAICHGSYGYRPSPAGPSYSRHRCQASMTGVPWLRARFVLTPVSRLGFRIAGLTFAR